MRAGIDPRADRGFEPGCERRRRPSAVPERVRGSYEPPEQVDVEPAAARRAVDERRVGGARRVGGVARAAARPRRRPRAPRRLRGERVDAPVPPHSTCRRAHRPDGPATSSASRGASAASPASRRASASSGASSANSSPNSVGAPLRASVARSSGASRRGPSCGPRRSLAPAFGDGRQASEQRPASSGTSRRWATSAYAASAASADAAASAAARAAVSARAASSSASSASARRRASSSSRTASAVSPVNQSSPRSGVVAVAVRGHRDPRRPRGAVGVDEPDPVEQLDGVVGPVTSANERASAAEAGRTRGGRGDHDRRLPRPSRRARSSSSSPWL